MPRCCMRARAWWVMEGCEGKGNPWLAEKLAAPLSGGQNKVGLGRHWEGGDGVELGEGFLADALEVADDAEEAAGHAGELALAAFPDAGVGGFLGLEVLAHDVEAVEGGFQALGELGA